MDPAHILFRMCAEGGAAVLETDKTNVDLDDLIFAGEDARPSER